jgi:hypothetical protein
MKGTTRKSPYFLVYGQDPLTPLELELKTERTFENTKLESFLEDKLDFIANLEAERELALEKTLDVCQGLVLEVITNYTLICVNHFIIVAGSTRSVPLEVKQSSSMLYYFFLLSHTIDSFDSVAGKENPA